jgi:predicted phosphate transport protein (TIGR00153 family)
MKFSLLPRQSMFFNLLQESAANLKLAAGSLLDLMEHYENVPEKVAEIKRIEEIGDGIIHRTMTELHKAFITPIDREDIAILGERLDDVVDCIEEAARYMVEYNITAPTYSAKHLSMLVYQCSDIIVSSMNILRTRGAKIQQLMPLKDQLNNLENEADRVTSQAMAELFNSYPAIEVIKWKEVYDQLEGATDRCEEIGVILEGIVIKHG